MLNKNNTDIKSTKSIINIIRRSLGFIDERLIQHGERVAYIADNIANYIYGHNIDKKKLTILCLLHDIGAYKTEEIDNMVTFETDSGKNHAVYGYVFLKNATHLGDSSEAILYHHTYYNKLRDIDTQHKEYAELIFLADRIDILLLSKGENHFDAIKKLSGIAFNPTFVDAYLEAEKNEHIAQNILDNRFLPYIENRISEVFLSKAEVLSFLKMLVFSIDFHSPFTVTHTANTTAISLMLAQLMGLSESDQKDIELGAFLHDIGKLVIPYSILENPGKLTPEQMVIMRTHVSESEKILTGLVSDNVCQIAVRHHEKLNGSGYCKSLTAENLTLPQRIVAVADIISALINRRSYKDPFDKNKAISIISEMRDKGELCPNVINTAVDNIDKIIEMTHKANDSVINLYEKIKSQYAELIPLFA